LFYKEESFKIKKEYRPKIFNKIVLKKKNRLLSLKKLFFKPPAYFKISRVRRRIIIQRKNFKKLKKEIFIALKLKKPKIKYKLLNKKANI
jgi:hypothetical protein